MPDPVYLGTMKRLFYTLSVCLVISGSGCKTAQTTAGTDTNPRISGTTNAPQSYYDNARSTVEPAAVQEISTDRTYGVTQKNPICVGGKPSEGVRNQQRYLNALRGPKGEETTYRRRGSCCEFKTPNGIMGLGLLDVYELTWAGNSKPMLLYVNLYDAGPLRAPVGLTLVKP